MKYLALLLTMFLMACSSSEDGPAANLDQACDPASSFANVIYEDEDLNEILFRADCTGYDQFCQVDFNYNKPDQGQIKLTVTRVWGANCGLTDGEVLTCGFTQSTSNGTPYVSLTCNGQTNNYFDL